MNKTELLSTYTAEQLAEMVVEMENVSKAKITKCEVSDYEEILKGKCDKCGEELILSLDSEYILCTKVEFYATKEANRQLNKDVDRLQSEVEKYRKAFEDAKKERDCQITEYQNRVDKDKTELERAKNTINQIDDILEKLFGVRHDVGKPDEFEKILFDKAKGNIADFLSTEPIKVADMLINAMCEPCASVLSFGKPCSMYDISELRQIAEHLLVYCNHNGEAEE